MRSGAAYPQELGDPGYDDVRFVAKLGANSYMGARADRNGDLTEVEVAGLAIAYGGETLTFGSGRKAPDWFLLIELDADAGVIEDWIEGDLEEAKEYGETRSSVGSDGLDWLAVPDVEDLRTWVRERLR